MKIFISHSSKDRKLVSMFCDLLTKYLHIKENEIFCTSMSNSVKAGEDFNIKIKENLCNSKIVVFLITPNYMKSAYSIMEMGAVWANKDNITPVPILTPPLDYSCLSNTPISSIESIMIDDYESLFTKFYQYTLVEKNIINRLSYKEETTLSKKINAFTGKVKEYTKENYKFDSDNSNAEKLFYIDEQIRSIKRASDCIYILMDSLNPESSNSKYIEFDSLLEHAKNKGKLVKILTRTGTESERSQGAYDICIQHNLKNAMKFSPIHNSKPLRCTIIDEEEIIISCSDGLNKELSQEYVHFYNRKVNELIKNYIDEQYNRDGTLTYTDFIFSRLVEMGVPNKETTVKRASEILGIPESSLIEILDEKKVPWE